MRSSLSWLLLSLSAACAAVDAPLDGSELGLRSGELRGWAPDDPRLAEWIVTQLESEFRGQGAGDQGPDDKPTTCGFNTARLCVDSPHPETTTCLQHRTPAFGFWLEEYKGIHCLNAANTCPLDADGHRVGDMTGVRLCKEPGPSVMTVCGETGPQGCAGMKLPCFFTPVVCH